MAFRAQRPCKWQNCNQLVDSGYCEYHDHKLNERRQQEQNNDSLRHYYKNKRWKTTRLVVLGRDLICKKCNRTASQVVHHIIDARIWIAQGNDFYDESNLEGLCAPCHNAISRERQ